MTKLWIPKDLRDLKLNYLINTSQSEMIPSTCCHV